MKVIICEDEFAQRQWMESALLEWQEMTGTKLELKLYMQNCLMQQQYEEIKSVYLNLRGWRHDYHNHIQVMKAFLDHTQVKGR